MEKNKKSIWVSIRVLFFLFIACFVVFIGALCKQGYDRKPEIDIRTDDLSSLSWETQKDAQYQLIRPLEFTEGTEDVWGLLLREYNWYAINMPNRHSFLKAYTDGGMGPGLVDNITRWNKIGIVDTVTVEFSNDSISSIGGGALQKFEVICLKSGFEFQPVMDPQGRMSLQVVKEEL